MGKPLKGHEWTATEVNSGVRNIYCTTWSGFNDFITNQLLDYRSYVFRGQAEEEWSLEPTIDRLFRSNNLKDSKYLRQKHLDGFMYASRGRRGPNPKPLNNDDERWALGQHNGLATPLLDWTESPYVAAYFAYVTTEPTAPHRSRVVYALNRFAVEDVVKRKSIAEQDAIRFVRLLSDDNNRLIAQRGLFTRAPDGQLIENWIAKYFEGVMDGGKLLKITVPNAARNQALKSLDRMNVNHLSLFPDLYGSAKYANTATLLGENS